MFYLFFFFFFFQNFLFVFFFKFILFIPYFLFLFIIYCYTRICFNNKFKYIFFLEIEIYCGLVLIMLQRTVIEIENILEV